MLNWTFCFSCIEMFHPLILTVNPFFLGFFVWFIGSHYSTEPDSLFDWGLIIWVATSNSSKDLFQRHLLSDEASLFHFFHHANFWHVSSLVLQAWEREWGISSDLHRVEFLRFSRRIWCLWSHSGAAPATSRSSWYHGPMSQCLLDYCAHGSPRHLLPLQPHRLQNGDRRYSSKRGMGDSLKTPLQTEMLQIPNLFAARPFLWFSTF